MFVCVIFSNDLLSVVYWVINPLLFCFRSIVIVLPCHHVSKFGISFSSCRGRKGKKYVTLCLKSLFCLEGTTLAKFTLDYLLSYLMQFVIILSDLSIHILNWIRLLRRPICLEELRYCTNKGLKKDVQTFNWPRLRQLHKTHHSLYFCFCR